MRHEPVHPDLRVCASGEPETEQERPGNTGKAKFRNSQNTATCSLSNWVTRFQQEKWLRPGKPVDPGAISFGK